MITKICNQRFESNRVLKNIYLVFAVALFLFNHANLFSQESPVSLEDKLYKQTKIAFTSERDGNFDIYVMNADGSDLNRLTNNPDWDEKPRWSPDGKKIAFMSIVSDTIDDRHWEVYVMNSDGSDQRRLTFDRRVNANPWWSPDGEKIVFNSVGDDGISAIYIMSADGSQQKRLTAPGGRPSWSGTGKQITFISFIDETSDISVINADGTGERNLTNSAAPDGTPAFSPDGSKIAFLSVVDGHYEIFVMNSVGSELKRLTNDTVSNSSPSWSPDGEKIIFHRGTEYDDTEIYIMNADGSNKKRLTHNANYDGLSDWSPFLKTEK